MTVSLSGRAVLLATDGSAPSSAAARVAAELAKTHHATVHVVGVVDTRPAPIPPPLDLALAMGDSLAGSAVHERQVAEVRESLEWATGHQEDWPVRITFGTPADAIVQEARRVDAVLIVMGLQRHGRLERAIQDETTLAVMRESSCAVLGVVAGAMHLPRHVVAAIDFSETSIRAARASRAVVAPESVLVLAYVAPMTGFMPHGGEQIIHDMGVDVGFARLETELARDGLTLDHVTLHHESPSTAATMLLEYAEGAHADLITAGSARHGRVDRWIMGSVSTDLVRDGRYCVLIFPPAPAH